MNFNEDCVGMNILIISVSENNAVIGFVIGQDEIRDYVEGEIEQDRMSWDCEVGMNDHGDESNVSSRGS